ncbi:alkaline phosphatase D family protein [Acuticoccus sp. I52.16.1]|uniref:alkaline phosphatase D family protein n=1 Tax=Acuticoccus sp. I52.16.1 TaxID=2928472 RepID=UPI001FD3808C|nr:alkaline phosphatase D family protein [Acuticoccus sp. I52.16.1]UOM36349.1 alkaline phosphatase family protein [Acuticoccus sp. I52.16.1]
MTLHTPPPTGPVLILDDVRDGRIHLAALFIAPEGAPPAPIETADGAVAPTPLARYDAATVWRARFAIPADRTSTYTWRGETHEVAGDLRADLRIAYVSCNGEEIGDLEREGSERNAMWARLRDEHRRAPFALLLHGGDQVYADEITDGHPLSDRWPDDIPTDPSPDALAALRHHLRERLLERYASLYRSPEFAWVAARVPSLMQWDDHDICDGWGSLPTAATRSQVGRTLFAAARESFLTFQHAAADGDLPRRFADRAGAHLGFTVDFPGLRILAPDLRSERTRTAVMGAGGWAMMDAEAARDAPGHTFLMSSVPLLGPRMSLLEALMVAIPKMQKYEDDLRDQWQSRNHREEWRRMLRLVRAVARSDGHDVVSLSGEIHLATRAVMDLGAGQELHQLVASGIAHRPPPQAWARTLGALAVLGEDPLPECPIRVARLPGQPTRYVAERNYLTLERTGDAWAARWELERSGTTSPLAL